jgi:hypothetical protein
MLHRPFEGVLGLIENLPDPQVNLARLDLEFLRQPGNRLLAAQMPANDVCLLVCGKMSASLAHGTILLLGIY